MYKHNKAQQSKNRVHISWDKLYLWSTTLVSCRIALMRCNYEKYVTGMGLFTIAKFLLNLLDAIVSDTLEFSIDETPHTEVGIQSVKNSITRHHLKWKIACCRKYGIIIQWFPTGLNQIKYHKVWFLENTLNKYKNSIVVSLIVATFKKSQQRVTYNLGNGVVVVYNSVAQTLVLDSLRYVVSETASSYKLNYCLIVYCDKWLWYRSTYVVNNIILYLMLETILCTIWMKRPLCLFGSDDANNTIILSGNLL